MKKAIFNSFGAADTIEIIETNPPQPVHNKVLVKVMAAALNPKDILIRKGKFKRLTGKTFPQGIGFDFSGLIENPGNSRFRQGDKVFGMINGWKGRTCAEYLVLDQDELGLLPDSISYEQGAGIPLAGQTALQALRDLGKIKAGDKVIINGASGGVGTLAIQIAKSYGAEVTTISSSKNIPFCKALGSDQSLSYEGLNISDFIAQYDIFFDVFGNYSFGKTAFLLTRNGSYITTVPKPEIFKAKAFNLFRRQKAQMVYVKSTSKDLQWLSEKISQNQLKPIVDKVFDLGEIQSTQTYIESKRAKGKVIIRMPLPL